MGTALDVSNISKHVRISASSTINNVYMYHLLINEYLRYFVNDCYLYIATYIIITSSTKSMFVYKTVATYYMVFYCHFRAMLLLDFQTLDTSGSMPHGGPLWTVPKIFTLNIRSRRHLLSFSFSNLLLGLHLILRENYC